VIGPRSLLAASAAAIVCIGTSIGTGSTSPASATARAFQPVAKTLPAKTSVPVLLPTYLPYDNARPANFTGVSAYTSVEVSHDAYSVELSARPGCEGGVCHLGSISAKRAPLNAEAGDQRVALHKGIVGFFVPAACGANCSDASLRWAMNGVTYTIASKGGNLRELQRSANSAIDRGVIR
jgi:hypothetical protein